MMTTSATADSQASLAKNWARATVPVNNSDTSNMEPITTRSDVKQVPTPIVESPIETSGLKSVSTSDHLSGNMSNSISDDGWTAVVTKKRGGSSKRAALVPNSSTHRPTPKPTQNQKIDKNYVLEEMESLIERFPVEPAAVFLFGSTARGDHRASSDLDVLCVWQRSVPEEVANLRDSIKAHFNKPVDLVNMVTLGRTKPIKNRLERDADFLMMINPDLIQIFGKKGEEVIDRSEMVGKLPK